MLLQHPEGSEPLHAFKERLSVAFGKHKADRICAEGHLLGGIRPEFRGCDLWNKWIRDFAQKEEEHTLIEIPSLAHFSDAELIDFLYKRRGHCPECSDKALASIEKGRRLRLEQHVQQIRDDEEAWYLEQMEFRY
jgi:hypothetical protein